MKLTVTRSGGMAGLSRTWVVVVDEQPDSDEWRKLLARIPWTDHPRSAPLPDRYVYEIRFSHRRVTLPEQQLTGPWRELVDRARDAEGRPAGS